MSTEPWLTPEIINRSPEAVPPSPSGSEESTLRRLLLDFVEVLDSLDRMILAFAAKDPTAVDWGRQLDTLHSQVTQTLEQAGLTFEDSLGQNFDPARHEAVARVERDDVPDYTITEVVERGCGWHGKPLRAARVIVSCRPKTEILDQEENKS